MDPALSTLLLGAGMILCGFARLAACGGWRSSAGFAAAPLLMAAAHGAAFSVPALALCVQSPAGASLFGGALASAALASAAHLAAPLVAAGADLACRDPAAARLVSASALVCGGTLLTLAG